MKKKVLKQDLIDLTNCLDEVEDQLSEISDENLELHRKIALANKTIADQITYIKTLNAQLEQQDKAIERKDRQFEGLKSCYRDDLINGRIG